MVNIFEIEVNYIKETDSMKIELIQMDVKDNPRTLIKEWDDTEMDFDYKTYVAGLKKGLEHEGCKVLNDIF